MKKSSPVRSAKTTTTAKRKTTPSTTRTKRTPRSTKTTRQVQTAPTIDRNPLSAEQKADITGIVLIVVALLSLMAALTSQSGQLTRWWTNLLQTWVGWGAYALPLILLALGAWFLLSRVEHLPKVNLERVIGVMLIFVNLLVWFELIDLTFPPLGSPSGGGAVGGSIYRVLESMLGKAGTMIVMLAWLLIALMLLVDLSVPDLAAWVTRRLQSFKTKVDENVQNKRFERAQQRVEAQQLAHLPVVPAKTEPQPQAAKTHPAQATISGEEQAKEPEWKLPLPSQLLDPVKAAPVDEESDEDRARVIEETLRSFNAPAKVVEIRRGPSITMFGVEPEYIETRSGKKKVRVSNITKLSNDIAMALKASRIRIQAPVPGKGYVGIEVPNMKTAMVSLLDIVESPQFIGHPSPLKFALGKDVTGRPFTADLASMPHLLVAGATNSGKSVCLNSILAGFLLNMTPDQLRLLLVDPKRVELTTYNGIPHLLADVIVDAEKVVGALQWMLREMDLRYRMFEADSARNIDEFNYHRNKMGEKALPYIVVVIDELADLMMLAPDETERSITRLAQLARATGIHLIIATQRPSTNVITGLIKANFPARIAFAVASNVDSRVILDQPGAERLLGKGDMLFQAPDAPAPVRLQGTYVSDRELSALTEFWRAQNTQDGAPERPNQAIFSSRSHLPMKQEPLWKELEKDPNADPIEEEAIKIIRKEGRASVSMLQRKLRIGYTRSSRLIEKLEEDGIIGPPNQQTGTREVLDWGDFPPLNED
ncbi:MAG: DNA translocase FtsK 4TM domain-containing protein [Anaerolineaceae bacterium]|nr:DNA translocase FtsK 4TM domain-containing protein [Anaerolineaceae bacterium]MDD4042334.1 DNA translocase FtsK 4TM domain-containing protein [Anaerolineaceae bacterium]MDD4578369.1 DNA translocase FtsK 4TM domain-containing protein [Anaerolineaceae bacterium]